MPQPTTPTVTRSEAAARAARRCGLDATAIEAPAAARKWRRVRDEVTDEPNAFSIMIFSRRSLPAAGALNHNPPQSAQCEPKRNAQTSLALHFDEGKGLAAKRLLFGSRR